MIQDLKLYRMYKNQNNKFMKKILMNQISQNKLNKNNVIIYLNNHQKDQLCKIMIGKI